jgi:hypothetical protein
MFLWNNGLVSVVDANEGPQKVHSESQGASNQRQVQGQIINYCPGQSPIFDQWYATFSIAQAENGKTAFESWEV